jgi:hypothetical protein
MRQLIFALLTLLAACGPVTPVATPMPTTPAVTGTVEIEYPPAGTVVYSEVLQLSGMAQGVPDNQFAIQLTGADEKSMGRATAQVNPDGTWTVEMVPGYTGEPMEVTILALPIYDGAPPNSDYTISPIVLAGSSYRPEGVFGSVTLPSEGEQVGGDSIEVSGTASGVFENQFQVELRAPDGSVVTSQGVTLVNPYFADEVPWVIELATNGYTGPAEIRAFTNSPSDGSEILLGSVNVTITQDAG